MTSMTSYILRSDDLKGAVIDYCCVHCCMRILFIFVMRMFPQIAHIKTDVGNMCIPHW